MAKVFIIVGHGGKDPGAVGRVREADANLVSALEMGRILEAHGVTVGYSRKTDVDDPLTEEINEANAYKPDLCLAVHNNAGGGDGFEAWVQGYNGYRSESLALGTAIEYRVKAIGQNSRGLKTKVNSTGTADWYGYLRQIKAPTVILEGFFVDSNDALDFDSVEEQKWLGAAYAYGVLDYLGIKVKEENNVADHWAQKHYDSLVKKGILDGGETSKIWLNFEGNVSELKIGQLLALIDKATN